MGTGGKRKLGSLAFRKEAGGERESSRDSVDVGCFGEHGVGGVPEACHKDRQGSCKPGLQRVLKLKGAKVFVVTWPILAQI